MDPERWRRIRELYLEARKRAVAERETFLREECEGDDECLREVRELLDQTGSTNDFLDLLNLESELLADAVDAPFPISLVGKQIGTYRLEAILGGGSMGDVYRARDTKLGRDVAVKVLRGDLTADADRRKRLEQEARVLASLNHPNIAAIYGLEDSDALALVLELVEGETLRERLKRGAMPVAEALDVARQIVDALDAAHARGIIHRDLKPANIKITPNGIAKVLDFGIAKVLSDGGPAPAVVQPVPSGTTITRTGAIMGTVAYMSPEQARGEPVDKRTDVWAFGCVLYEMLAGRRVFAHGTVAATLDALATREPEWSALPGSLPFSVRRLLHHCLEKDASLRLREIGEARASLDVSSRRVNRAVAVVAASLAIAMGGVGIFYATRSAPPPSPARFTQITNFTDSAVAPRLSRDGTRVTFIRGGEAFLSRGQIYTKALPDGEAVQLTHDASVKYGPVFTPDGSRVAYTRITSEPGGLLWDTWEAPALGGEPAPLLSNAAGLTWLSDGRMVFAAIRKGLHMGVVSADATGNGRRDIYFPRHERAMAHYAYPSPDRQWSLVVEMDQTHVLDLPCRLIPMHGRSAGSQVGPQGACTSADWSPDGQWMYFTATVRTGSHVWRQRFPDGVLEQLTFGPTEEDGVSVAPDGRSLITSLGTRRSAIWIHDVNGERALTSEGYARFPRMSRDGSRVFFLRQQSGSSPSAELRVIDLRSGKTDAVLPGHPVVDYDISRDETQVAFTTIGSSQELQIWLASLDGREAPRQVARAGDQVSFGADGDLIFRSLESPKNSLVRIRTDGSRRAKLTEESIVNKYGVSPDGKWVTALTLGTGDHGEAVTLAIPVGGGAPRRLCSPSCPTTWSADGRLLYVSRGNTATSPARALAIPIPHGQMLPDLPPTGISSIAAGLTVQGALLIEHDSIAPGPHPSTYTFTRVDLQQNLYRIPLD